MKQRDLFISHASQDAAVAQDLRAELEGAGYTCWMAPDDIVGSRPWAEQILSAIESSQVMVVLISRHANDSVHVSREVNLALERARAVLPIRIEEVSPGGSLGYLLSLVQRVDAFPPPVSIHIARIRRMIDAIIDNLPEDDPRERSEAPAMPGGDLARTEPSPPQVEQVRRAAVGPTVDQPGVGRRADSRGQRNVTLTVGAGVLALVGIAIIGGALWSGGAASSPAPSDAAVAGRATPASSVSATNEPAASPSTGAMPSGSPGVTEDPLVPTPVSPSASAAAEQLIALIPEAAGSCGEPMDPAGYTWIAELVCTADGAPGVVAYYSYVLYPDAASLREDYLSWQSYYGIRTDAAGPCGDGLAEEGPWRPDAAPLDFDGRFFCGTKDGAPGLMWTDGTTNVLAEIKGADGADLGDLYALWSSRSLDPVRP